MKYGLIGEKLGHSYSCQVHRALGNPDYVLKEIAPDALGDFLRARDFAGLNVTIPYKQAVIPYVDALTDTAREVGAVNTLYFDASGALWGDNTDVYGFCTMLEGIDVRGKKALVLGSGGTSDPLNQRASVGWKATKVAVRLDDSAIRRIETCSTYTE